MQQAQNDRLTQVGPDAPMGRVMRRYWLPFALSSELPTRDCPPIRVRLLGEDLVAFRDTEGKIGLIDAFCTHRRAPLFFGRNEECGLRCSYHGWKFDREGRCVDLPSEEPQSRLRDAVGTVAYATWEGGGMVWAYMGPNDRQPDPPDYELVRAPLEQTRVSKTFEACNYLQALEGGIDTTHSAYVHNIDIKNRDILHTRDPHPRLEVDDTDYGFRYCGQRDLGDGRLKVRVTHFVMPVHQIRGTYLNLRGEPETVPTINGHIWVPVDDETTCVFNWMVAADSDRPMTDDHFATYESFFGRSSDDFVEGTYWLTRNLSNDYLIDRDLQRTTTFMGITGFQTQDYALQEGMGRIVDRTKEHLGKSDRAIIAARRLLLEAAEQVEQGVSPKAVDWASVSRVRPADMIVPSGSDWRSVTRDQQVAQW